MTQANKNHWFDLYKPAVILFSFVIVRIKTFYQWFI